MKSALIAAWKNGLQQSKKTTNIYGIMKKTLIALIMLAMAGCQTSDEEIRADIAGKAQQDLNFSGLNYTVKNGVVDFYGKCPSDKALAKIQQTIKNIHVIKAANYRVMIAPVPLDEVTPLKLQVDSILGGYPLVDAAIDSTGAVLKGEVKAAGRTKLIEALRKLPLKSIKDSLSVEAR